MEVSPVMVVHLPMVRVLAPKTWPRERTYDTIPGWHILTSLDEWVSIGYSMASGLLVKRRSYSHAFAR